MSIKNGKWVEDRDGSLGLSILAFVIKLGFIASMVCYIIFGWREVVVEFSSILNSFIMSAYYIIIALTALQVLKVVMRVLKLRSARHKTVSTLVASLIKYIIATAVVIIIMFEFLGEAYVTELFAGLGIVAVVIGLGCQSLISDIIAGVFMVFESNFQVGDVVVVNSWRGTVREIGLRTTVIEDINGNVNIINNSSISELINNSKELSFAECHVGIEYDESLERVEQVIADNLVNIKEAIPEIVRGPFYRGVHELGSSAVDLLFVARCKEDDIFHVRRQLNRQFKLLFDAHDINIPFNQITLSQRVPIKKAVGKKPVIKKDGGVRNTNTQPTKTRVKVLPVAKNTVKAALANKKSIASKKGNVMSSVIPEKLEVTSSNKRVSKSVVAGKVPTKADSKVSSKVAKAPAKADSKASKVVAASGKSVGRSKEVASTEVATKKKKAGGSKTTDK